MQNYIIVDAANEIQLATLVNQKILEGYVPIGGICSPAAHWLLQAMIKSL